jgi:hypothetical protein
MDKPKLKGEKVCYVGTDTSFFQNILERIRDNYPQKNWEFHNISGLTSARESEVSFETLFVQVLEVQPCMIYIDFTEKKDQKLLLAESLSRDPLFKEVPLIGLVDKKEETKQCLGSGLDFLYVKGGEFHDLVYSAMTLAFSKIVKKPQFAKAKVEKEVSLFDDFRVGYIAPTYIHVEGNFDLKEGSTVFFKNEIPLSNVPSQKFIVKNRSQSNLYYDFNYSYDLDFLFINNDLDDVEGDSEEERARKERDRETYSEDLKRSQKKHKQWVVDRVEGSAEKKTKLLIVDRHMRAFRLEHDFDPTKSPYSVHYQSIFSENLDEIFRQRPAIIAYQMMGDVHPDEEELFLLAKERSELLRKEKAFVAHEDAKVEKEIQALATEIPGKESSELSFVKRLVEKIKSIDNYNPIIVLFRCYFKSSKALQESFQYPMIVTHSQNVSIDVCLNLAEIFDKRQRDKFDKLIKAKVKALKAKDPQKYRNLSESDFKENKYFIKKSNSLSHGGIETPIILKTLSESEVTFRSDIELPMKTYRLEFPLPLSLHLVPIEEGKDYLKDKNSFLYKGIIHSISETDKRTLRHKVNEVIFEPINEKRQKEHEEFKELNDKVYKDIKERKENIKKSREQAAIEELGLDKETD